jgi:hypothetical protein
MSNSVDQLKTEFETFLSEMTKFQEKGNSAAGTRARKSLLEMGKLTKTVRTEIQDAKNTDK